MMNYNLIKRDFDVAIKTKVWTEAVLGEKHISVPNTLICLIRCDFEFAKRRVFMECAGEFMTSRAPSAKLSRLRQP
jgi:hypothetical protein